MEVPTKKILIIDESVFSRICSAILELEGYKIDIFKDDDCLLTKFNNNNFMLIITSYPFNYSFLDELIQINLPTIILTDQINRDIINLLDSLTNSYCMIKPIDYEKFRSLVKEIVSCGIPSTSGYNIL